MNETQRDTITSIVGVLVAFIILVAILWALGLFDFSGTDSSAKIIAATIALVGTFFTAMVTFTGLLLRHSIERRNLKLQEDSHERRKAESAVNQLRLQNEAAIKAVELFKTTGSAASQAEVAGALHALSNLGQLKFVIRLLPSLWSENKIDTNSAIYLIDDSLKSADKEIQFMAACTLYDNAAKLPDDKGSMDWPSSLFWSWRPDMHEAAKQKILAAFVLAILSRKVQYWELESRNWIALWLAEVVQTDTDDTHKSDAACTLRIVLTTLEDLEGYIIHPERGDVLVKSLREMSTTASPETTQFQRLLAKLEDWAHNTE